MTHWQRVKAKPQPAAAQEPRVTIRWREENDPRRLRRVAEILADIMDTARASDEGRNRE